MSIEHGVLGILMREPSHGYRVVMELERLLGGGKINNGQVYEALKRLEQRGCLEGLPIEIQTHMRPRRSYRVTARGRQDFHRWLARSLVLPRPLRDDALLKLALLRQYAPDQGRAALERLRMVHIRRVARARSRAATVRRASETTSSLHITAEAFLRREEAELQWIEFALGQDGGVSADVDVNLAAEGR